jgi:hypothetical protein
MIPRLPLEGIRVLELAMVVAGPFCGVLMAEKHMNIGEINGHQRCA